MPGVRGAALAALSGTRAFYWSAEDANPGTEGSDPVVPGALPREVTAAVLADASVQIAPTTDPWIG